MLVRNVHVVHVYAQFLQNSKLAHIHVFRLSNPQPPKFQSVYLSKDVACSCPYFTVVSLIFSGQIYTCMTSGACVLGFTFCEMFPQYQFEGKLIVNSNPINY